MAPYRSSGGGPYAMKSCVEVVGGEESGTCDDDDDDDDDDESGT